jgi:hypothetical protein
MRPFVWQPLQYFYLFSFTLFLGLENEASLLLSYSLLSNTFSHIYRVEAITGLKATFFCLFSNTVLCLFSLPRKYSSVAEEFALSMLRTSHVLGYVRFIKTT